MKKSTFFVLGLLMFVAISAIVVTAFDDDDDSREKRSEAGIYATQCTTDYLNVRSGPSTSSSVIKTLPPKTPVDVQSTSGDWSKIGNGQYVHKGYLGPCSAPERKCTTDYLNVRSGPSTSSSVIKTLPPNTPVDVQSTSGDWSKIGNGQYVHKGYLGACGGGTNCGMAYENGRAIGNVNCVQINGKAVTTTTANAFNVMKAAASKAGVNLHINSGFRTYAEQEYFYNCYITKKCNNGNLAAKPGYSNHQNGKALDIQTSGGAYEWLQRNGSKYGFVRTVPSETWHWEYRPGTKCNAYVNYSCT